MTPISTRSPRRPSLARAQAATAKATRSRSQPGSIAGTPLPDGDGGGDGEDGMGGGRRSGRQRIKSSLMTDDDFVDGEAEGLEGTGRKRGGRASGASSGGGSKAKPKVCKESSRRRAVMLL